MTHDFRTIKEAVVVKVRDMNKQDPNWSWKVTVNKGQIKVFWSYLEYKGNIPPFIITDGTAAKEESLEEDEFIVLRNERDEYLSGRIVGTKNCWEEGTLEECVVSLLSTLWNVVNSRY